MAQEICDDTSTLGFDVKRLSRLGTQGVIDLYDEVCKSVYGIDQYCKRNLSNKKDFLRSPEYQEAGNARAEFTKNLSAIADELLWRQIKERGLEKTTETSSYGRELYYLITYDESTNTCLGISYNPDLMATSYALMVNGETFFEDEIISPPKDIVDSLVTVALLPETILYDVQTLLRKKENLHLGVSEAVDLVLSRKNMGWLDKIENAICQAF